MCLSPSACLACAGNLPPNPLPKRLHTAQAGAAAAPASFAAADAGMADADGTADSFPDASPGTDAADTDMQQDGDHSCGSGAGEGPVSGSLPVVASFLASCEAAAVDEEDDAAAADEGYRGEFDEGHPGDGDEGDSSSWGGHQQQDQQQQQKDRQSLLGLGGAGQVRGVGGGGVWVPACWPGCCCKPYCCMLWASMHHP